jgi:hypothetical protein
MVLSCSATSVLSRSLADAERLDVVAGVGCPVGAQHALGYLHSIARGRVAARMEGAFGINAFRHALEAALR